MSLLNDAAAIYVGSTAAVAVYVGSVKVWPTAPPGPPPPAAWPVIPDAGLVMQVGATWAQLLEPGPHPIDLQLTQDFRDAAGFIGSSSPTWRPSDYLYPFLPELTVTSASVAAIVAAESASSVTLELVSQQSPTRATWAMVVTP